MKRLNSLSFAILLMFVFLPHVMLSEAAAEPRNTKRYNVPWPRWEAVNLYDGQIVAQFQSSASEYDSGLVLGKFQYPNPVGGKLIRDDSIDAKLMLEINLDPPWFVSSSLKIEQFEEILVDGQPFKAFNSCLNENGLFCMTDFSKNTVALELNAMSISQLKNSTKLTVKAKVKHGNYIWEFPLTDSGPAISAMANNEEFKQGMTIETPSVKELVYYPDRYAGKIIEVFGEIDRHTPLGNGKTLIDLEGGHKKIAVVTGRDYPFDRGQDFLVRGRVVLNKDPGDGKTRNILIENAEIGEIYVPVD